MVAAILVTMLQFAHATTFSTTGVYDENTTQTNAVDVEAASNNITLAQFKTDVLAAFNANQGGVVYWDDVTDTNASVDVTYGISQSKTLTITVTDLDGNTSVGFGIQTANSSHSIAISGDNIQGTSSGGTDFGLIFSKPLLAFGDTAVMRDSARTVDLTIILADDSNVTFAQEAINDSDVGPDDDTFYGYRATYANPIVAVRMDNSGFTHWDDLGFIVVPEPATFLLGLFALAGLCVRRRKRRR